MSRALRVQIASQNPAPTPATTPRRAPRERVEVGRVWLLNQHTLGAVHGVQVVGRPMSCRLEGSTLIIEVDR